MAEPGTRKAPGQLVATAVNSIKLARVHEGTQPHAPGHRLGSLGLVSATAWNRYQNLFRMCPHHGLERWLILQIFYKGLTPQTRAFVDSAAGGGIMNKTLEEAFTLIENMASHHFQCWRKRLINKAKCYIA